MNDAISPGRKNRQNSRLLSPSARFSKYHTVKLSKFNRSVRVLETSHLASSTSRCLDCPVTECQSRACLVVETHRQCKRQSRTPSYAGYDHHNRRLQERLGCSASILSDQWQMVPKRVSPTHQLSRAKGVLFGLENLSQRQVSRTASLQLDNTTAIAYIDNKGGTRSPQLMTLALEMWDCCQERDILVIASHIPGRDNVSADKESREFTDMSEWKLDPKII